MVADFFVERIFRALQVGLPWLFFGSLCAGWAAVLGRQRLRWTDTRGVGIGELPGAPGICELQKMYCLPEARGTGIARALMDTALAFTQKHYRQCYLETMENMIVAQRLYEKCGFIRAYEPIVTTGDIFTATYDI